LSRPQKVSTCMHLPLIPHRTAPAPRSRQPLGGPVSTRTRVCSQPNPVRLALVTAIALPMALGGSAWQARPAPTYG
jgi:hypothetical protein